MPFLNSITQLREITWGAKYLWDVRFPEAPAPFNEWFPAVDIDEGTANLESLTIESSAGTFKVPRIGSVKELSLTFFDDANNTLHDWIASWVNETILGNGSYVSTVDVAARKLQVLKLNHQRQVISQKVYRVYPEVRLAYRGSSGNEPQQYTVPFVIVGGG